MVPGCLSVRIDKACRVTEQRMVDMVDMVDKHALYYLIRKRLSLMRGGWFDGSRSLHLLCTKKWSAAMVSYSLTGVPAAVSPHHQPLCHPCRISLTVDELKQRRKVGEDGDDMPSSSNNRPFMIRFLDDKLQWAFLIAHMRFKRLYP